MNSAAQLLSGIIRIKSINISNNVCNRHSALYLCPQRNQLEKSLMGSTSDAYMNLCNFVNNQAAHSTMIEFNDNNQSAEECEIINNSQIETKYGILLSWGSVTLMMNSCCFIDNNKCLFAVNNAATLILVRCNLDQYSVGEQTGSIVNISLNVPIECHNYFKSSNKTCVQCQYNFISLSLLVSSFLFIV
jgi:hypothetical protein